MFSSGCDLELLRAVYIVFNSFDMAEDFVFKLEGCLEDMLAHTPTKFHDDLIVDPDLTGCSILDLTYNLYGWCTLCCIVSTILKVLYSNWGC